MVCKHQLPGPVRPAFPRSTGGQSGETEGRFFGETVQRTTVGIGLESLKSGAPVFLLHVYCYASPHVGE